MSLLPTPQCPKCGNPIAMAVLRERMSSYLLSLGLHVGIVCNSCGARLALNTTRPIAIAFLCFVLLCAAFFYLPPVHRGGYTAWHFLAILPLLMAFLFGPAFAQVRVPRSGEGLRVHGDVWKQLEEDLAPAREVNRVEVETEAQRILEISAPDRAAWNCTKCRAGNPATFDLCWQCQSERPQA
jgi:hypothetical protein